MNIIIPMAGRGSRLRPHTLTTPKPLIPVGGVPIVHRLVEDIVNVCGQQVENIGFVIGDFGADTEAELLAVAKKFGATGHIFHQLNPLGTGHAVLCAEAILHGPVVVAFADTLFRADFNISSEDEGILWVKRIPDPSNFGVVKMNELGEIIDFVEKPKEFVSDLAMIGVYYFKDGNALHQELNFLVDNDVIKSGEYQLPDALRRLTEKGTRFKPGEVLEWLDCGNKEVTVATNLRVLELDFEKGKEMVAPNAIIENSVVIPPCFIGENVRITNSVVGPHVSIGKGGVIHQSIVSNALIQENTQIRDLHLENSMIGSHVVLKGSTQDLSIGDYNCWNA
ncbi:MAG: sugar phosphate nucleotidyltransferase [Flavobacteriia bacterium]|jgi:glucose-1-phosphate thymidylyltransferase|nr:nucleotidyltransferase [Flavobacteriia bacterium]